MLELTRRSAPKGNGRVIPTWLVNGKPHTTIPTTTTPVVRGTHVPPPFIRFYNRVISVVGVLVLPRLGPAVGGHFRGWVITSFEFEGMTVSIPGSSTDPTKSTLRRKTVMCIPFRCGHDKTLGGGRVRGSTRQHQPDRATRPHEHRRTRDHSKHPLRQTATPGHCRWWLWRTEGNSSGFVNNRSVLIQHHCSIRLHSSSLFGCVSLFVCLVDVCVCADRRLLVVMCIFTFEEAIHLQKKKRQMDNWFLQTKTRQYFLGCVDNVALVTMYRLSGIFDEALHLAGRKWTVDKCSWQEMRLSRSSEPDFLGWTKMMFVRFLGGSTSTRDTLERNCFQTWTDNTVCMTSFFFKCEGRAASRS